MEQRNLELSQRLTQTEHELDRARQRHRDLEQLSDRDIYVILPADLWFEICTTRAQATTR